MDKPDVVVDPFQLHLGLRLPILNRSVHCMISIHQFFRKLIHFHVSIHQDHHSFQLCLIWLVKMVHRILKYHQRLVPLHHQFHCILRVRGKMLRILQDILMEIWFSLGNKKKKLDLKNYFLDEFFLTILKKFFWLKIYELHWTTSKC